MPELITNGTVEVALIMVLLTFFILKELSTGVETGFLHDINTLMTWIIPPLATIFIVLAFARLYNLTS